MYHFIQINATASLAIGIISLSDPTSDQPPKQCQYRYNQYTQYEHTNQVVGDICLYVGFDVHE